MLVAKDCKAIHNIVLAMARLKPSDRDVADILDLLSRLDQLEKQHFWDWLHEHDPNLKKWLIYQGNRGGIA